MALTFYAGGRQRRLFRRSFAGNFYVRFQHDARTYRLCLGTTLEHVAKVKARTKIEDVINGDFVALERSKEKTSFCPLGAVLERYQPSPECVDPATVRNNKSQLRLLVREGAGIDPDEASMRLFVSDAIIKSFQRKRMDAVRSADLLTRQRTAGSINSTVLQAKSVLSPKYAELYSGLNLPDLTAFRKAAPLAVNADRSFVPFAPGVIERIDRELPQQSRNVQVAALLMRYAGMRNKEVQFAKWEWFRRWPATAGRPNGTATLSIELRPYFKVKNESVRTLQLDEGLVARLMPFWGADGEWVIEALHEKGRRDATHLEINAWLRTIILGRTKCAYELRKHAASVILTRPGGTLAEAARFLGDTIQTTQEHYARFLNPVHAVRANDCGTHLHVVNF